MRRRGSGPARSTGRPCNARAATGRATAAPDRSPGRTRCLSRPQRGSGTDAGRLNRALWRTGIHPSIASLVRQIDAHVLAQHFARQERRQILEWRRSDPPVGMLLGAELGRERYRLVDEDLAHRRSVGREGRADRIAKLLVPLGPTVGEAECFGDLAELGKRHVALWAAADFDAIEEIA